MIDVGPEAGSQGGTIVIEGTPEDVASYALAAKQNASAKSRRQEPMPRSYTGEYLAEVLTVSKTRVKLPPTPTTAPVQPVVSFRLCEIVFTGRGARQTRGCEAGGR